ncbi:hypothetical protein [Butyrivibrio sp. AE3004]|uniref:hypothetical protein n=1 Tax=Butyrivibrio sp. AE3004 TaxID=1506994 RepID=UPI000493F40C|nr:hypothetical protein [Butyrivibrio sp. AE3004]
MLTQDCSRYGLIIVDSFDSSIRFLKKKDTAYGYEEVLRKHDKIVIESYDLLETDTELYLTEQVNNIKFEKNYSLKLFPLGRGALYKCRTGLNKCIQACFVLGMIQ